MTKVKLKLKSKKGNYTNGFFIGLPNDSLTIVLATSGEENNYFHGTVIYSEEHLVGLSSLWEKRNFSPIKKLKLVVNSKIYET